ncbi:MAG TPA: hypothetical protein VFK02_07410 [Kofleriaceae bacterium]|nr:hypothetical protein [Kofleriaceae bacterium]
MKKNGRTAGVKRVKLALDTETVAILSRDRLEQVAGGLPRATMLSECGTFCLGDC